MLFPWASTGGLTGKDGSDRLLVCSRAVWTEVGAWLRAASVGWWDRGLDEAWEGDRLVGRVCEELEVVSLSAAGEGTSGCCEGGSEGGSEGRSGKVSAGCSL